MDSIGHRFSPRFSTPLPLDPYASMKGRKRMKCSGVEDMKEGCSKSNVIDHSDPFALNNWLKGLDQGKFGSVTNEIEEILEQRAVLMNTLFKTYPFLANSFVNKSPVDMFVEASIQPVTAGKDHVVFVEDDCASKDIEIINLDDDEEPVEQQPFNGDFGQAKPFQPYQEILLNKPDGESLKTNFVTALPVFEEKNLVEWQSVSRKASRNKESFDLSEMETEKDNTITKKEKDKSESKKEIVQSETKGERLRSGKKEKDLSEIMQKEKDEPENKKEKDKGVYLGVEDDDMESDNWNSKSVDKYEGLADIWQMMAVELECSKGTAPDPSDDKVKDNEDECDHSFILKEDIGYVCRICGVIQKKIETIIEYQKARNTRNPRLYKCEGRGPRDKDDDMFADGFKKLEDKFISTNISIHPRHSKQMKGHQIDGFNFLLRNLVTDNPGGCILAHAPGSGKTFMVISFLQSFMAKYPSARPLIVLPKGLLDTWKNEFRKWQVENIPIYDCYSGKTEGRAQQFEVLKKWSAERSILLVGYQQFSSIMCDDEMSKTTVACQEILVECPSIMILDEGHTPRNTETNNFSSLEKVRTPRKVVLSGTLYQNHVQEVFNVLNLVRPKFLKMEKSKSIKKRILSRVSASTQRGLTRKTDTEFYDSVEHTLLKDENFNRKATIIQDLREMTSSVLHYYKGDCLEDLPGLVDYTVFLNLSPLQKRELTELRQGQKKFKISADGSSLYVHPRLKPLLHLKVKDRTDEDRIDDIIDEMDENEGVKCKFYLNLLRLCESAGEKLLVFSQYLLPLRFLERLTVKIKGWSPGREIFMITGDSDNDARESARDGFNNSPDAKVFFGSIKACGEGISLVGASRIIVLDVPLNPSVTRQAIGRAFRPGQTRKVYTYRLIAAESPEEEDHAICFKKESIAKLWFEWNEYSGEINFEMESANAQDCGDVFLETPFLHQDIISLHRR